MTTKNLLFLCLSLLSLTAFSQEFNKVKLDQYFDAIAKSNQFMGSVAIAKDGTLIYSRSIGFADVANKLPANDSTKYRVGSISKTFTAILVLKAVDDNKLTLDQPIAKWFPKIKNANTITVSQLLQHRSGIHNFTSLKSYLTWNTSPKTEKQLLDTIVAAGIDFEPGTKFSYSNSNYILLTQLIQKIYKQSYASLIQEKITGPLGLKDTYVGGKISTGKNEAKSYKLAGAITEDSETDSSITTGAGAIVSTPSDLVKFSDALFRGLILHPETFNKMTELKDGYGYGLVTIPFFEKQGFGHTGGVDSFSSIFIHFADQNVSYALCSNGSSMKNNDIHIAVLSAVYNRAFTMPQLSSYTPDPATLDSYPGTYSSQDIPLKLTISRADNTIIAQATGQPSFPLTPSAAHQFKFEPAGVEIIFDPAEKTLLLKQGGRDFKFKRDQ